MESANSGPLGEGRVEVSDAAPLGAIIHTLLRSNPRVKYPALKASRTAPGGLRKVRRHHQIPDHKRERCGVSEIHNLEILSYQTLSLPTNGSASGMIQFDSGS